MESKRRGSLGMQGGGGMNPYRGVLLASAILLAALPLSGCGNALEGGSSPSGSVIRLVSVAPATLEPDIYLSVCEPGSIDPATGEVTPATYESGLTNTRVTVTMRNESRPNTPDGSSTNSYVTMSRYRVDFTGLNKTVSIPTIDGAAQSVGLPPEGVGTMEVLVVDFATLDYIRNHYPTIGYGESLTLRATITIWGEDAFKVRVSTQAQVTLVIDNYDRC